MTSRIDTSRLEPIGFATSRTDVSDRWTELRLFYRPGQRRPYLAEVFGGSIIPGETPRLRQRVEATLEKALDTFDNTDLAEAVRVRAQEWEDAQEAAEALPAPRVQFDGAGGLVGALRWLYADSEVETDKEPRLVDAFAEDFGVPARTVRYALSMERSAGAKFVLPSWCAAFVGALMHFDREAFHAMRRTS